MGKGGEGDREERGVESWQRQYSFKHRNSAVFDGKGGGGERE